MTVQRAFAAAQRAWDARTPDNGNELFYENYVDSFEPSEDCPTPLDYSDWDDQMREEMAEARAEQIADAAAWDASREW